MTTVAVTPNAAFVFLADPRHAPEWFAAVAFARDDPDAAPAQSSQSRVAAGANVTHVGATWRFLPNAPARQGRATPRRRAAIPVRMAAYEPPKRFAWETTYPSSRDNLRWEITCVPADGAATGATDEAPASLASAPPINATTPAIAAQVEIAASSSPARASAHTRIHMTLRIQPGPLGWVWLLVAAPFTRGGLDRRAQRALDRARETLTARAELSAQPRLRSPRPRSPRRDDRRSDARKRRR